MSAKNKKTLSITRSQFQANSLKILKRTEEDRTPVLITKYGFITHIVLPLERARVTQFEQIPVEKYLDEVFAQWGPDSESEATKHENAKQQ